MMQLGQINSTRLTLYAILSAIESDLRRVIVECLAPQLEAATLFGPELHARLLERYQKDEGVSVPEDLVPPSVETLVSFADFADSYEVVNKHSALLSRGIQNAIKKYTPRLERLAAVRNRVAHTRPLQFDDLARTLESITEFLASDPAIWSELRRVSKQLQDDPGFVFGVALPTPPQDRVRHNLPLPDFDETGFLGRAKEVSDITKLCLGPYPVITIVGDGGLGKTALALKVAYDFLDSTDQPFDAVIWASSKTTRLTAQEIVRIENAISTSLGLLQNLSRELGGDVDQPVEEVLELLNDFRILLIIDNLETIIDRRIREFLERLPKGSKILITSRIGLGAFEFPYLLKPLESTDSVRLLRALCTSRQISALQKLSNARLAEYCGRMHNSPGYIKWFVNAVQAGKRPEEVLANPGVFLDFCLSNVYGYLSEDAQVILRSLLSIPSANSQAELAFMTQLETLALQKAIQQLLTTNVLNMTSVPAGSSFESHYGISDLPREYLLKHHPVPLQDYELLRKRYDKLISQGEQIKAEVSSNPFSLYSIRMRSGRDLILARYLLDAIAEAERDEFTKADKALAAASDLEPEYFEVHRVKAFVEYRRQNYPRAHDEYETAVELEPNYAPLRHAYAMFAMTCLNDLDLADAQLREGLRIEPKCIEVEIELARVSLYARRFDDAKSLLNDLVAHINQMPRSSQKTKTLDMMLQYYTRLSDHQIKILTDAPAALQTLVQLQKSYSKLSDATLDQRMRIHLSKAIPTAIACVEAMLGSALQREAEEVLEGLQRIALPPVSRNQTGKELAGEITRVFVFKSFGFIAADGESQLFFHKNALKNPGEWSALHQGTRVYYHLGQNKKGPCAVDVRIDPVRG